MKITIKCPHIAQQYLIGGGHDLVCVKSGRVVTTADCFNCKAAKNAKSKGASK